jgi:hypothetical protein
MSISPDLEDPIVMDCPGSGCPGNLSNGWSGLCQYCNDRLALTDTGLIPAHQTADIIAMIGRGDFGPRSAKNRSRS